MRRSRTRGTRGRNTTITFLTLLISAAVVCWAGDGQAQLLSGHPGDCAQLAMPVDSVFAMPRVVQCTEGSFHPNGDVRPDDTAFFQAVDAGVPLWSDFLGAFAGGTNPIAPADAGLTEHYSGAATMARVDSAAEHTSTELIIENRGSGLLAPEATAQSAGLQWQSLSSVEVIPFRIDGATESFPVTLAAEFAGAFHGQGGEEEALNSSLSYNVTVHTRAKGTGELTQRGNHWGIVGFDGDGTAVADGTMTNAQVLVDRDGTGNGYGWFLPLDILFQPDVEESLIVTTRFAGFGSFEAARDTALADGSETGVARISSPDAGVRFRHSANVLELIHGDTAPPDGQVDIEDLNAVRNHFGSGNGNDTSGIPGDTFPFDGRVNVDDLNAVRNQFGTGAGSSAVPEPSTVALVLVGLLGAMCRRFAR